MLSQVLLIPLLAGPVFILAGIIQQKFPPRKTNSLYGYRTKSSMKSEMRWAFAQAYSSIEMIKLGFFLLLTSSLGLVIDVSRVIEIFIGLGLMILIILLFFIRIEKAIKNKFGND